MCRGSMVCVERNKRAPIDISTPRKEEEGDPFWIISCCPLWIIIGKFMFLLSSHEVTLQCLRKDIIEKLGEIIFFEF
jgi:hypothetical protein